MNRANKCKTLCVDSKGDPKQSYPTEQAAQSVGNHQASKNGIKLKVYKCPYGNGFHLSKKIK